jgi:hypothetical protein
MRISFHGCCASTCVRSAETGKNITDQEIHRHPVAGTIGQNRQSNAMHKSTQLS